MKTFREFKEDVRKMPDGRYGVYADKFKNKKRVLTPKGKHAKELKKVYKTGVLYYKLSLHAQKPTKTVNGLRLTGRKLYGDAFRVANSRARINKFRFNRNAFAFRVEALVMLRFCIPFVFICQLSDTFNNYIPSFCLERNFTCSGLERTC